MKIYNKFKIFFLFGILAVMALPCAKLKAQVPGGVTGPTMEFWLASDYLHGLSAALPNEDADITNWMDLSGNGWNFQRNGLESVPKMTYEGMNYNPAVAFYQYLSNTGASDDNPPISADDRERKLVCINPYTTEVGKSYYTFWVSEVDTELAGATGSSAPSGSTNATVFTFYSGAVASDNQGWRITRSSSISPVAQLQTSTSGSREEHQKEGLTSVIGAIIRPNISTSHSQDQYVNGIKNSIGGTTMRNRAGTMIIGTGNSSTGEAFFGNVHEIIVYSGSIGQKMSDANIQKIHSYLAIKYGISLDSQDYVNSSGTTVWDGQVTNKGYSQHVFGLAHDRNANLHVKQATSTSSSVFTAFVGNLATLNIQNTTSIPEGIFCMFGSNGENGLTNYRYEADNSPIFLEGTLLEDITFRDKNIWKVQLTGTTSLSVKLNAPGKYVLVSDNDPSFDPSNTRLYKIDNETGYTEIPLKNGQFISFAYFAKGPGGVVDGLRMWLDAGDKDHIKTDGNGNIASWKDKSEISNTMYSYQSVNSANKAPGYDLASLHTNFYPAVNYREQGQYLSTNKGPASVSSPDGYTVFHVIYNDFIKANRSYFMSFGSKISNSSARRPVFGMRGYTDGVRGRLWETGGAGSVQGREHLFEAGATSINVQVVNKDTRRIRFESNGKSEELGNGSIGNGSRMNGIGVLGGGSAPDWQMLGVMAQSVFYERVLTEAEKDQIYSYLALKYAVTLRMPIAYNYKLSDGSSLWDGTTAPYSAYHNNVAALVHDAASDLHNNVARSTDVGATITMMLRGHKEGITGQGDSSLFENDLSALIWGHDNNVGHKIFSASEQEALCGLVKEKFEKIWLVKKTSNLEKIDVSIRILEQDLSGYISPGYQLVLLVADNPEKLRNNNWDLAIPSSYLKNEKQQAFEFTFSEGMTYFSIGIKPLPGACEACDFEGSKQVTFTAQSWTRGAKENTFSLGSDSLGIPFSATVKTDVNPITWSSRYPRVSSQNSLRLRRRREANTEMITRITPSSAAATQFQIFNLDREGGRYKQVEVYGLCENGIIIPTLTTASNRSSYSIAGNVARALRRPTSSYTNNRGKLNVSFDYPVDTIFIKEKAIGATSGSQTLGIGPIRFSCPAPIPPYSEAGIAFSKQATDTVTYCGFASMIDYTFRIYSANCDRKGITIIDTLPQHLTWDSLLIAMPSVAMSHPDFKITISDDKRVLKIDSMTIPGSSDAFMFTAKAHLINDEVIVGKTYENQAWLQATIIKNDTPVLIDPQPSADYYRGVGFKSKTYVKDGGVRLEAVKTEITSKACYVALNEVQIIIKINNPNPSDVTDMVLDIDFNEEFTFVNRSIYSPTISGLPENPEFEEDNGVRVPGYFYLEGFTLPGGKESIISFKIKAPAKGELIKEVDEDGNPIDWDGNILTSPFDPDEQAVTDLVVGYSVDTEMDDYCISSSFIDTNGESTIPFCRSKECIIINKMLQPRIQ